MSDRRRSANLPGGGKTFVGPVDDPFFVDLGAVFDGINIDKPGRADDRARQPGRRQGRRLGLQHALVRRCRCPQSDVTRDGRTVTGPKAANAVVGVWSTTERQVDQGQRARQAEERWKQVSRLGNPLINEVVIPIGREGQVQRDVARRRRRRTSAPRALSPEPAKILNALFNLGIKENDRTDIVQALLTGVPGLTQIAPQRRPGGHAEGQPRRAADRQPEPLRRARG